MQTGIVIEPDDLTVGVLPKTSLIRCEKIYTLEQSIVVKQFGVLSEDVLVKVTNEILNLITERVSKEPALAENGDLQQVT